MAVTRQDCKPVTTPLAEHFILSAQECPSSDKEKDEMRKVPYASTVGCLIYAMFSTRLLAETISVVSKYIANLGKQHWNSVKWFSDI
ncbi:unnamed protein product [Prunus armeniaca]